MFEIEQKYHVDDRDQLLDRLRAMNAVEGETEQHHDTYYNHPSRDFAETQEAFRIRRVNGIPMITYKGEKLPGEVKARRELEWRLDPGDPEGSQMEELLETLSFRRVATVEKRRRCFRMGASYGSLVVVLDHVLSLGSFAEIEQVVENEAEIEAARQRILALGAQLGLLRRERQSYLRMILAQTPQNN